MIQMFVYPFDCLSHLLHFSNALPLTQPTILNTWNKKNPSEINPNIMFGNLTGALKSMMMRKGTNPETQTVKSIAPVEILPA